ncbi:phosphonopyruvate decarboxylase [Paenibacillus sp. M1]|uniref:Phosphonopyruvate decarboxylase n=1 Tax=Paenibacillus haidiansis TaxID=1574488 RepID=A0ABU7VWE4_9BACL
MPINTKLFGDRLKKMGFNFYSGVPCSFLQNLINYAINDCEYIMAANEGDAVAVCAGAYLGGRKSVFLCQNSGLTNAISPLTSLNYTFRIPVLGFVSLRGESGLKDEPQHELMGQITTDLLDVMRINWAFLSHEIEEAMIQLVTANEFIESGESFFFVVKKGTFEKELLLEQRIEIPLNERKITRSHEDQFPKRSEVLSEITRLTKKLDINLATTGLTGRELYEVGDLPNNLYMVGSMGAVSSLGLGLALSSPKSNVVVIDGDGSFLMRMGAIATNAYYKPSNMFHLLLDNNAHESTGGQKTVSGGIDFISLAADVGYSNSIYIHNLDELIVELNRWKSNKGLTFAYIKIFPGTVENLGRPRIKPYEVKERLIQHLKGEV